MEYGIILFGSTHDAMNAEKVLLKENKLPVRIMPTPTAVKATCGFALRYELESEVEIFKLINDNDLVYESLVHVKGKGLNVTYQTLELA